MTLEQRCIHIKRAGEERGWEKTTTTTTKNCVRNDRYKEGWRWLLGATTTSLLCTLLSALLQTALYLGGDAEQNLMPERTRDLVTAIHGPPLAVRRKVPKVLTEETSPATSGLLTEQN